jgi:acyl-CoA thioesterase FadM
MYPLIRLGIELLLARTAPPLPLDGVHVSRHTCWPWDVDPWCELNNGRTLTLYDLGRVPLAVRCGLTRVLRANRWGLTVAGSSVRYRRRVRAFDRFELRSAFIGRDARFLYVHQAMFRGGEALSAGLFRGAVTDRAGIVTTDRVVAALGDPPLPGLPAWAAAWSAAEAERPWPPQFPP